MGEKVFVKDENFPRLLGVLRGKFGYLSRSPQRKGALSLPFLVWEGSPTKIDYRKGTLILTSLLEDLFDQNTLLEPSVPAL